MCTVIVLLPKSNMFYTKSVTSGLKPGYIVLDVATQISTILEIHGELCITKIKLGAVTEFVGTVVQFYI